MPTRAAPPRDVALPAVGAAISLSATIRLERSWHPLDLGRRDHMHLEIRIVHDEAGDDLRALARWLRRDDDLKAVTIEESESAGPPDEMGPFTDFVRLVGEPEVIAAVIGGVTTWVTTRSRTVKVRLKKGNREVEVEGSSADDPQKLADELMDRLNKS